MTTTPEATSHHSSRKFSILLALRAIQNISFHYKTPCSSLSCPNVRLVQNYYQKVANKSMSCLVTCLEQQHGVLLTEKHICTAYLSMQYIPFNGQPFETRNTYILALRAAICLFFSCHGISLSSFGVMRMVNSHTYLNINQRLVNWIILIVICQIPSHSR